MINNASFRGKGIASREWYYGDLIQVESGRIHYFIIQDYEIKEEKIELNTCASPEVIPETVGQYIGQKDINGEKIYTGDIVEYQTGARFIIVFEQMLIMCPKDKIQLDSPGYFGILIGDSSKELCPLGNTEKLCKIIGNIYDYTV